MRTTPRLGITRDVTRIRPRVTTLESRLTPTTFTVTSLADAGPWTLRQAILDANALLGADVINFTDGLTGTILLTGSLGNITEPVDIVGPGADKVTVDAGNKARHLTVGDGAGSSVKVSLSGLTLQSGLSDNGGSIRHVNGHLSLTDMVLRRNAATKAGGAVSSVSPSTLTIVNSQFLDNAATGPGGALCIGSSSGASPSPTVLLQDSLVSGNRSEMPSATAQTVSGGGITIFYGNVTITRCVISNNLSEAVNRPRGGGGVAMYLSAVLTVRDSTIHGNTSHGCGGGILAEGGTLTIENSTLSGNTARKDGGWLFLRSANTTVRHSTIASNTALRDGGGVYEVFTYDYATRRFEAVVISGNAAPVAPDLSGELTADFCLLSDSAGGVFDGANNYLDVDARLGHLALNGGPTPTHRPASPSILRNAGPGSSLLPHDQRGVGFPRLLGATTDVGAVESAPGAPVALPVAMSEVRTEGGASVEIHVTYVDDTGIASVQLGTGDVRVIGPGGFDVLATFQGVAPGPGPGEVVGSYHFAPPDGTWDYTDNGDYFVRIEADQVFDTDGSAVAPGLVATVRAAVPRTVVVNATNDEAVDTDGKTSLREAVVFLNAGDAPGRVMFDPSVFAGPVTITLQGELTVTKSVDIVGSGTALLALDANKLSRQLRIGTAFHGYPVSLSKLTLLNGQVGAGTLGGAIYSSGGADIVLSEVTIRDSSSGRGGAIGLETGNGSITANDSVFVSNSAAIDGGAIFARGGTSVALRGCLLTGNTAGAGGAVKVFSASIIIEDSTLDGNSATAMTGGLEGGGAIHVNSAFPRLRIANSTCFVSPTVAQTGRQIKQHPPGRGTAG